MANKVTIEIDGDASAEKEFKKVQTGFGKVRRCLRRDQMENIISQPGKHIYLYPLNDEARARVAPMAKEYPKASEGFQRTGGCPCRRGRGSTDLDAPTHS